MSKLFNHFQNLIYLSLASYGEGLQEIAARDPSDSCSWMAGHLSDFSLPAASVAVGQILAGRNKAIQYVMALAPPIVVTLHELGIVNVNPYAQTYDPQDIICYWAGAALAFTLSQIVSNKSASKLKTNKSVLEDKL